MTPTEPVVFFPPGLNGETRFTERRKRNKLILPLLLLIACLLLYGWQSVRPNNGEPKEITVTIPEGSSVRAIGQLLEKEGVIRSADLFPILVRVKELDTTLPSGQFRFQAPASLFSVVAQLAAHERGIVRLKITIPEGYTTRQMAALFSESLPQFAKERFLEDTKNTEGYLFPDTYFFFTTATSGEVIATLSDNFALKTKPLLDETALSGRDWRDIVIMASIIEEEAVTDADRRIVSGILWNRIARGMRLQVDASFAYIMDKASSEITLDDLNVDSPYNTYRYAGLPAGPIANPGLASLDAALHPTPSTYLYYLSDKDGVMHYAKTFEEHKLNKARYLR